MPPSFFLASIRFVWQRGSRQVLLECQHAPDLNTPTISGFCDIQLWADDGAGFFDGLSSVLQAVQEVRGKPG